MLEDSACRKSQKHLKWSQKHFQHKDRFFVHLQNRSFLSLSLRWTRYGISCRFITLSYLSQISLLNFRSCPWVILLITNTFVPYTGLKASWVQTRKALLILPQEFSWHLFSKCFWNLMRTLHMKHSNFVLFQKLLHLNFKIVKTPSVHSPHRWSLSMTTFEHKWAYPSQQQQYEKIRLKASQAREVAPILPVFSN